MGDENIDLCECLWGHELAMRRLLNVIRNSQNNCADNECFEEAFQRQDPSSNMFLMVCIMAVAMFLYYFRPRTQRLIDDTNKPSNNNGNNGGPPPNPPTLS